MNGKTVGLVILALMVIGTGTVLAADLTRDSDVTYYAPDPDGTHAVRCEWFDNDDASATSATLENLRAGTVIDSAFNHQLNRVSVEQTAGAATATITGNSPLGSRVMVCMTSDDDTQPYGYEVP